MPESIQCSPSHVKRKGPGPGGSTDGDTWTPFAGHPDVIDVGESLNDWVASTGIGADSHQNIVSFLLSDLMVAPAIAQPNSAVKTARDSAAKSRATVAEAQQVEFN